MSDFRALVDEADCTAAEYADWITNIRVAAGKGDRVAVGRLQTIENMEARLVIKREIARVLRVGLDRQIARAGQTSPNAEQQS